MAKTIDTLTASEREECQLQFLRRWLGAKRRAAFDLGRRWQHGTHYGFRRGCRCGPCALAYRAREDAYNARERARWAIRKTA